MTDELELTTRELSKYDREWLKSVGRRRLTAIERALADPELVSLRCELVKIDLRIAELEEQMRATGETLTKIRIDLPGGTRSVTLGATVRSLEAAVDAAPIHDDEALARIKEHVDVLKELAELAASEDRHWEELKDLIERRRRLAATEQKWEKLQKVLIPTTRLALLFDELHQAIQHVVVDEKTRLALLLELRVRLNGDRRGTASGIPIELPPALLQAGAAAGAEAGESADAGAVDDVDDDEDVPPSAAPRADQQPPR